MTKRYTAFGAVLVLVAILFLAAGPAYALDLNQHHSRTHSVAFWAIVGLGVALGLAGTATVTYLDYPGATVGTTTAPTTTQASHTPAVTAQIVLGDGDTTATITHNMVLSTTQLNAGRPWLRSLVPLVVGTAYPALSWALNTNTVVITKGNTTTGSGGTYECVIERPSVSVTTYP